MTDLHRACKTLRTHLTQRRLLHATLDEQSETGVKAADYTPSDKPAPIDPPPRPDPTGEQAISGDRARQLRGELDQAESRIVDTIRLLRSGTRDIHQAIHVVILLDSYGPRPSSKPQREAIRTIDGAAQTIHRITVEVLNPVKLKTSDLAHLAHDGAPGCQSCARHAGWWNEPTRNQGRPTDLGGRLPEPWLICEPCYRFVINRDRPPSVDELTQRKANPRGHWPKRYDLAS